MRVEFINPFVSAAQNVFQTMLGCSLSRGSLSLESTYAPRHEVRGIIGVSGQYRGMVVVSFSRDTAISVAESMLGTRPEELNSDVMDAVGELTNMIVGAAKTQLAEYQLTIGLPIVVCGKTQSIAFPSQAASLVIPFEAQIGAVCIQVGLVDSQGD
jgi:chemotaxis protein CheX